MAKFHIDKYGHRHEVTKSPSHGVIVELEEMIEWGKEAQKELKRRKDNKKAGRDWWKDE